jgi:hypothetical protein
LSAQSIDVDSIDVYTNRYGRAELTALGARSVPVVALVDRYTLAQSIQDVVKFLDLKTKIMESLRPEQLVAKLDPVLRAAARYTRQFCDDQLRKIFRNRDRTVRDLSFHVFHIAEMGLLAAQDTRQHLLILETNRITPDQPLTSDDLNGLPPPDEAWDR